jgi:DNA-damage-inducible protein D
MTDGGEQDPGGLIPFTEDGGRLIRRQWHEGRWYFSVVDVVGLLTDSATPRQYWYDMKARIQDEGFRELSAKCLQLKMRSLDGKMRATDAADVETLLRIIQSIPSPKAEPVKQWLAGVGAERIEESGDLTGLSEDQHRIYNRDRMTGYNKSLSAAAGDAGVITARDFAVFHDHGYMGLYGGERMRDIHARKGLARGEHILDHMGSEELASNIFRAAQTEAKVRRERIQGKAEANQAHFDVGRTVRQTIAELGGTMPEELPTPPESIQQVRAREWRRELGAEQHDLFGQQSGGEDPES